MALMVFLVARIKIKILKAGKLNKHSSDSGFTLMELIVVIVIMGVLLVFTIPEVNRNFMRDDTETTLNWIIFTVNKLKKEAVNQRKDMFMCMDQDSNTLMIKQDSPELESPVSGGALSEFVLPGDVTLNGIEFNSSEQDTSCIKFSSQGYSDYAIIHLSDDDGQPVSCLIQPFLDKVKIHWEYLSFE
jgi:prepilin-type N-terminal cleavage/methylation domain-containing protein